MKNPRKVSNMPSRDSGFINIPSIFRYRIWVSGGNRDWLSFVELEEQGISKMGGCESKLELTRGKEIHKFLIVDLLTSRYRFSNGVIFGSYALNINIISLHSIPIINGLLMIFVYSSFVD